jgi:hypothetical protein
MELFLAIVALIGLILFVIASIFWFVGPTPRRTNSWALAVIGLVIWAVATIILGLMALF